MAVASGYTDLAIKTSGLRMVYNPGLFAPRKIGLENLDLEVPAGSIFGFIGPNGSGKTTTIRMIMNITAPDSGQIRVFGAPSTRDTLFPTTRVPFQASGFPVGPGVSGTAPSMK
jgi:ABC-type multidrug transport system ATPase subunit